MCTRIAHGAPGMQFEAARRHIGVKLNANSLGIDMKHVQLSYDLAAWNVFTRNELVINDPRSLRTLYSDTNIFMREEKGRGWSNSLKNCKFLYLSSLKSHDFSEKTSKARLRWKWTRVIRHLVRRIIMDAIESSVNIVKFRNNPRKHLWPRTKNTSCWWNNKFRERAQQFPAGINFLSKTLEPAVRRRVAARKLHREKARGIAILRQRFTG